MLYRIFNQLCVSTLGAPLKKQKSWVDYDAVIRNTYIKDDNEVSQKPSDSCKCMHMCTHVHKHTHIYTYTYTHTHIHAYTHIDINAASN